MFCTPIETNKHVFLFPEKLSEKARLLRSLVCNTAPPKHNDTCTSVLFAVANAYTSQHSSSRSAALPCCLDFRLKLGIVIVITGLQHCATSAWPVQPLCCHGSLRMASNNILLFRCILMFNTLKYNGNLLILFPSTLSNLQLGARLRCHYAHSTSAHWRVD